MARAGQADADRPPPAVEDQALDLRAGDDGELAEGEEEIAQRSITLDGDGADHGDRIPIWLWGVR